MLDVLSQLLKREPKIVGGILLQNHHELYPHITKAKLDIVDSIQKTKPIDRLNSLYDHPNFNFLKTIWSEQIGKLFKFVIRLLKTKNIIY